MTKLKRYLKHKLNIRLSIPEIIDIVLENQDLFETGLCRWISDLYLTDKLNWYEYLRLSDAIRCNKPGSSTKAYWWKEGDIKPRLEFLEQIKQTKK